jgi:hypothetical protein
MDFSYGGFCLLSLSEPGIHDDVRVCDYGVVSGHMCAALLLRFAQCAGSQLATGNSTGTGC